MIRRSHVFVFVALAFVAASCQLPIQPPDGPSGTVVDISPGEPIASAMLSLRPGDTLRLHGGDYNENVDVSVTPGASSARITMTNVPGERPVIHGRFFVHEQDYWTFDGINVTWPETGLTSHDHLVGLINGVGWTWTNSEVWGAHSFAGILIAGTVAGRPANWTLSDSCVHDTYPSNDTNQDHNLYVNTGVSAGAGLISHNLFYNATNGMGVKLGGPTARSGGAARVSLVNNTIYNSSQNVLVGWQSHDNVITGNIFAKVGSGYANVRGYELSGVNNTTHGNAWWDATQYLMNDPGYNSITEGGGELHESPDFDTTTSCSGFHVQNPALTGLGR